VLLGTPPPENAARNRIAFKTGTSYGYRDAWAVGFDGRRTIGVWVGRPDGAPVPGILGRTAAAPILFDAFARTGDLPAALPQAPKGAILAANGRLPLPLQRFNSEGAGIRQSERVRIMFPPHGARLELAATDGQPEPVALKIAGGVEPLTILVNGVPQERGSGRTVFFDPQGPGFVRLTVVDGKGTADSVLVRLQ
jgi:penicillin-binding protein 1C